MSGLEVIGVVASIIQIADLGAKLSIKLCTFYRTVKVANESLKGLSSDISLTCSILTELGEALKQDDQAKVCSNKAFTTAQDVLTECESVFNQIESAIEKHNQEIEHSRFLRGARKITAGFFGPNLEVLKCNLERLKSTMLLMLNVIMYAGQLRERKAESTLIGQRDLIQSLFKEKEANDSQFNRLGRSLESLWISADADFGNVLVEDVGQPTAAYQHALPKAVPKELGEYYNVIQKVLHEIDACQHSLEQSRHLRIRNGIVNVHSMELVLFQHIHGRAATQLFEDPFFKLKNQWISPAEDLDLDSSSVGFPEWSSAPESSSYGPPGIADPYSLTGKPKAVQPFSSTETLVGYTTRLPHLEKAPLDATGNQASTPLNDISEPPALKSRKKRKRPPASTLSSGEASSASTSSGQPDDPMNGQNDTNESNKRQHQAASSQRLQPQPPASKKALSLTPALMGPTGGPNSVSSMPPPRRSARRSKTKASKDDSSQTHSMTTENVSLSPVSSYTQAETIFGPAFERFDYLSGVGLGGNVDTTRGSDVLLQPSPTGEIPPQKGTWEMFVLELTNLTPQEMIER